ncbi:uncharacterized protein MELLADRAFT_87889 [Melampsora larici-populina 98AG31]|uniref:Uncharacterized protein n=1 Tax=Melampsora larici-populina (strain 98AG31 / pathotype 3-4-7) TaxID=747676 RepID=F4RPW5_MELLP|nr:uncharacterized protein MELLADRAFT_87889 [Melampsora larici-populina 98AG31]EGG05619.1 hypothetical protein MELLADRAFT_87889 [Melampsora larici-populina 98AG31]
MIMFQNHREQRDHAAQREVSSLIDESKLVTINLWDNPVKPKAITALFPFWPKACFNESPLLVQALQTAIGPHWNRAIIFWDKKINAWRDTLDSYPHRFSVHQRSIVVRLPQVEVPLAGLPSLTKSSPIKPPTSSFLSSSGLPPICDLPSSPRDSSQPHMPSQQTTSTTGPTQASTYKTTPEIQPHPTGVGVEEDQTTTSTPRSPITIDLTGSPDDDPNQVHVGMQRDHSVWISTQTGC